MMPIGTPTKPTATTIMTAHTNFPMTVNLDAAITNMKATNGEIARYRVARNRWFHCNVAYFESG
jgi:hypothetical protein